MDIVLFGIQGSGKGTQAKRLATQFKFDIFEAGGELRKIAASGTELGKTVQSYIDKGHLVPHEIIMQVVKEAVSKRSKGQRILFDGIPRDADQQRDFDAVMSELGRDFRCIEIKLAEDEAVKRILGRAKEQGRADDADLAIIKRRMDTFRQKTVPVIQKYDQAKKMAYVEGNLEVDEVYVQLSKLVQ